MAGCEAALHLANRNVAVTLFEAKPVWRSGAHSCDNLAEIVCSNSLKSMDEATASGMLKRELELFGCSLLDIARKCAVPAGSALAVNRENFAKLVTEKVTAHPNITVVHEVKTDIDDSVTTIVAAGPLCHEKLSARLQELLGDFLHFYDAASPIVTGDSIDYSKTFIGDRYGRGTDDYINCPLDKQEYAAFYDALTHCETVITKPFEKEIFESCMPVEVMAKRGFESLRYGIMRPVGFGEHKPYAVLQLRRENSEGTLYNLVGCQTNAKFSEQKRVFSLIPALHNAEFVRYGVMHRNSFIDAPHVIDSTLKAKRMNNLFIVGQLCGVEGYVESIAAGLYGAENVYRRLTGRNPLILPRESVMGALFDYIARENKNFQPMNANFGILPDLTERFKDKLEKKRAYSARGVAELKVALDKQGYEKA